MQDLPPSSDRESDSGTTESRQVYSLAQVARLFRTSANQIKRRAFAGDLPYRVNQHGRLIFYRDDLLPHLDELIKRNNRIG